MHYDFIKKIALVAHELYKDTSTPELCQELSKSLNLWFENDVAEIMITKTHQVFDHISNESRYNILIAGETVPEAQQSVR